MTTPAEIRDAIARMRLAHADVLAAMTQAQVVDALCCWARHWENTDWEFRREAEALCAPFPWGHVRVSMDGLLRSLTPDELWALIDSENVREARGVAVAGHVIAGNTPLLAWTSVLRGLLMRSAAVVKLPSGAAGVWGDLFARSLAVVSPALGACVALLRWPGGTEECDRVLCENADMIIANGSDASVAALRNLTPPHTPFVGYGHALSFGLVLRDADWEHAAQGLARDILIYDGGGCLSVKAIFVKGRADAAQEFGAQLAEAMETFLAQEGMPPRTPQDWQALDEARILGAMQPGAVWISVADGSCGVLAWPDAYFRYQSGPGVITVQPWPVRKGLATMLAPVAGHLQGCAVAGEIDAALRANLAEFGISRISVPGALQEPPLAWRQDGRDVLRQFSGDN